MSANDNGRPRGGGAALIAAKIADGIAALGPRSLKQARLAKWVARRRKTVNLGLADAGFMPIDLEVVKIIEAEWDEFKRLMEQEP